MKAGRKKEGRQEHAHSTLDHPHKIQRLRVIPLPQMEVQELVRLGGDQHGLLVREREHEGGGAHFVFDFEGISSSSPSSSSLSLSSFNRGSASIPSSPSTSAQPHLARNPDLSFHSNSPASTDTAPPTSQPPSPPCMIPYRHVHTHAHLHAANGRCLVCQCAQLGCYTGKG